MDQQNNNHGGFGGGPVSAELFAGQQQGMDSLDSPTGASEYGYGGYGVADSSGYGTTFRGRGALRGGEAFQLKTGKLKGTMGLHFR